jgi:hypothetical protein
VLPCPQVYGAAWRCPIHRGLRLRFASHAAQSWVSILWPHVGHLPGFPLVPIGVVLARLRIRETVATLTAYNVAIWRWVNVAVAIASRVDGCNRRKPGLMRCLRLAMLVV